MDAASDFHDRVHRRCRLSHLLWTARDGCTGRSCWLPAAHRFFLVRLPGAGRWASLCQRRILASSRYGLKQKNTPPPWRFLAVFLLYPLSFPESFLPDCWTNAFVLSLSGERHLDQDNCGEDPVFPALWGGPYLYRPKSPWAKTALDHRCQQVLFSTASGSARWPQGSVPSTPPPLHWSHVTCPCNTHRKHTLAGGEGSLWEVCKPGRKEALPTQWARQCSYPGHCHWFNQTRLDGNRAQHRIAKNRT